MMVLELDWHNKQQLQERAHLVSRQDMSRYAASTLLYDAGAQGICI
jgi:hypothetical protein